MSKMLELKLEDDLISSNKDIFAQELTEVIKPLFTGLEHPTRYSVITANILEKSNRTPFPRQARLINAATEYIKKKKNKSLIISSEMGTGKCILPDSNVVIDGQVYTIEDAYEKFADLSSVLVDKTPNAYWFKTNQILSVPSYDKETRKFVKKNIQYFYKQKVSEVIREVKTKGNFSLKTTKAHKFLTPNGWTNKISVGDYVAIPKTENIFGNKQNIINPRLLAWLLGEGYFGSSSKRVDGTKTTFYISLTQKDDKVFEQILQYAKNENKYSITTRKNKGINEFTLYKLNSLKEYLKWGVSKDKEIPDFMMQSTKEDIVKFLAAYIDAEGSVLCNDNRNTIEISTASKTMAYQLSSMLRKINVVSQISTIEKAATNGTNIKRTYYRINIGGSSVRTLINEVAQYSIVDYKKEAMLNILNIDVNNNIETVYAYDLLVQLKELTGLSREKTNNILANVYVNGKQKTINKKRALKVINLIDNIINKDLTTSKEVSHSSLILLKEEMLKRVEQEIIYVQVTSINEYQYDGYVYDLSIEDTHNFIAENMLVHNTQLAINISQDDKFSVNFILCPPHLVDKWEDEILGVYKKEYHKKIKIIKVSRWEDLSLYTKRDMRKDGVKYYFIISRESAKLGYPKQTAVNVRYKTLTVEKNLDGQTFMIKQRAQVATCPDCDATLKEEEDGVLDLSDTSVKTGIPYKCECGCVLRQVDKSVSPKMQTRISIAEYVKRTWTKGAIDLLVVDEAHEYKGGATGQGNALAQLCSMSKKIVGLTGTLLNGYASSLFYLLYRFNPHLMNKTLGYDYKQLQLFVETYGAHEEVVQAKEVSYEGVVTKMGKRMNIKEKPKISPYLLSVLLDMTIFLRLDEIKIPDQGLPDYDESIELVDMEEELRKPYMDYLGEISSKIRKDKRFLGNLATDAIAVPDMPFRVHSAQGELFYEPPFSREEFGYTNKEKRALELVKSELSQGRKVLLYVHFSNKGVADDLLKMLEKELPQYIHKFLSPTINANKRQAWIEKNPSDVLICNPELVKTGLDLLQFPTIIFYESTYNVFTLKQASRRSWRIGQRENVKVIFMAYSNTPQHKGATC